MGGDPNEMDTSVIQTISMNWPPNRRHTCEFYFSLIAYTVSILSQTCQRCTSASAMSSATKQVRRSSRRYIARHLCTCEEVSEAPVNGSMVSLMDSKGFKEARERLPICREFEGWMTKDPPIYNTVWLLKNYLLAEDVIGKDICERAYGFHNCLDGIELKNLKLVYKILLLEPGAKPLELWDVMLSERVFEYAEERTSMKGKERALYRRLMKGDHSVPVIGYMFNLGEYPDSE
ncbi:hypothetical protein SISSUDRAFT_586244 [Sistotremastrum suecicum HHB10207 ss-3]|uniref:Uncharacterized protein n=1 Tax=Sistotremastrum suecicum HHB10207 ss-3 TaxID=1314776 RepID=A0A165XD69_9AGAM|nr:hypothetical protein SISSUDRAFT_586244 [Sistotremastrum suecicum HHB10207 ss-3]